MKSHKDLIVWQKSMDHVAAIYVATKAFPKEELFGIVSQMRRAAVSIPSNIAEGYGRLYDKETVKFLSNALGSASELETQLIISKDLGYLLIEDFRKLINQIEEIIRMLSALIKSANQ
ncbi:MAG: four helix bundle protein [Bacteroidaceae bacterium]|nr:four helix bundle protein [Bacteroidaceae bacterium]